MNYNEVLTAARDCVGPYCKACPVCNGRACGNAMPGPGSKAPGNVAARNYDKWQEICINMDTLYPSFSQPDISFTMFGRQFAAPVFAAPIGGLTLHYGSKFQSQDYNPLLIKSAAEYGTMAFTDDAADLENMRTAASAMAHFGGLGCPTIKPWNKEAVFERLDLLAENNIFAAAMDVDAAGLPFLKAMSPDAGSKSVAEMQEIISYAKRPFIIKGIMTPSAAEKAVEAGAAGIVVSNHGGRVQGGVPSTAEVLPEIVHAVKGKTTILVDGGIRSGLDIFRALALGADAVLVGRPVVTAIYGAGQEGFRIYMDKLTEELKSTMTMCGTASLKEICRENIWCKK